MRGFAKIRPAAFQSLFDHGPPDLFLVTAFSEQIIDGGKDQVEAIKAALLQLASLSGTQHGSLLGVALSEESLLCPRPSIFIIF